MESGNQSLAATAPSVARIASRTALVDQVAQQLAERIIAGEFDAGEELPPEGRLAEALGVSRTVVREAMQSLRSRGLVEVSQGRRPRVRPADAGDVLRSLDTLVRRSNASLFDLLEVRRPLEGEIAAQAARRATPEHLERLARSIDDLLQAPDLERRVEADMRFHNLLAEAGGNPLFGLLLMAVSGPLWESRRRTITRTGAPRAVEGHRRILEQVRRQDAEGARREMLIHLDMAGEDLQ